MNCLHGDATMETIYPSDTTSKPYSTNKISPTSQMANLLPHPQTQESCPSQTLPGSRSKHAAPHTRKKNPQQSNHNQITKGGEHTQLNENLHRHTIDMLTHRRDKTSRCDAAIIGKTTPNMASQLGSHNDPWCHTGKNTSKYDDVSMVTSSKKTQYIKATSHLL